MAAQGDVPPNFRSRHLKFDGISLQIERSHERGDEDSLAKEGLLAGLLNEQK